MSLDTHRVAVIPGVAKRRDAAGPQRFPTVAQASVVSGVLLVAYAAMAMSHWPSRNAVAVLTDFAFPAASAVYVPLAALAAYRARGRLRAAWLAVCAGFLSWAVAEVLWTYFKHAVGEVPYPSWADFFYLLYVPCIAVALLLFPSAGTWQDKSRLIVDGLVVTGSFFLISWLTVMRPIWQTRGDSRLDFALTLAYPAGDVLIMTLGVLVLLRAPAGLRRTLALFVAALTCSAVGNGLWSYLGDATAYRIGGLADVFYAANILLFIVALVAAQYSTVGDQGSADSPGRLSLWLPLLPVAVAAAFVVASPREAALEAPVTVTGVLLVIGALVRQLMQGADLVGRERKIRVLADQVNRELDGAADYVASILPSDLTGPVAATSRYLPSRAVGGDSFGYTWVDDDHFIVYLIDVSGHGVRSALLSVSVHNLLRSNSLAPETLLAPDQVLTELNSRFSMKKQDGHYFTMWYGVYQRTTGVLRYASGGHLPPLVLTDGAVALDRGEGLPLGMFGTSRFSAESIVMPGGAQLLLYSDGVVGNPPRVNEFVALCTELSERSEDWLDALVQAIPAPDGHYEDDCSLVLLRFPEIPAPTSG